MRGPEIPQPTPLRRQKPPQVWLSEPTYVSDDAEEFDDFHLDWEQDARVPLGGRRSAAAAPEAGTIDQRDSFGHHPDRGPARARGNRARDSGIADGPAVEAGSIVDRRG